MNLNTGTLAQSDPNGNESSTPGLDVSRHMGTIITVCLVLIVVAVIVKQFRKKK